MSYQKRSQLGGPRSRVAKRSTCKKTTKSVIRSAIEAIKKLRIENAELKTELTNRTANFQKCIDDETKRSNVATNTHLASLDRWTSSADGTVLFKLQPLLGYIAHPDIPNLVRATVVSYMMTSITAQMADAQYATFFIDKKLEDPVESDSEDDVDFVPGDSDSDFDSDSEDDVDFVPSDSVSNSNSNSDSDSDSDTTEINDGSEYENTVQNEEGSDSQEAPINTERSDSEEVMDDSGLQSDYDSNIDGADSQ